MDSGDGKEKGGITAARKGEEMKSLEKATADYEKAKEKMEASKARYEADLKRFKAAEIAKTEAENLEIVRIIRAMDMSIVSQLKYDNEMKLTDEYWINYQKGKGSEEFQKYMEDLTDMQNHVLPYLQSFCNLEEKGVKERREQQIAERYEGRADERVTSTEANEVVKDVGKTDRKPAQQKQAVDGKDKKLSIHERLEINKRIIQEKQGKDKTERGVDLGVRTV